MDEAMNTMTATETPAPAAPSFEQALAAFVEALNTGAKVNNEAKYASNPLTAKSYEAMAGGRAWIRVASFYGTDASGGRCAHCFVEVATGNVFKPASWKGPERNFPRGNIYAAETIARASAGALVHSVTR